MRLVWEVSGVFHIAMCIRNTYSVNSTHSLRITPQFERAKTPEDLARCQTVGYRSQRRQELQFGSVSATPSQVEYPVISQNANTSVGGTRGANHAMTRPLVGPAIRGTDQCLIRVFPQATLALGMEEIHVPSLDLTYLLIYL